MYQLKKSYSLTDLTNVDDADSGGGSARAIAFAGSGSDGMMDSEFGECTETVVLFSLVARLTGKLTDETNTFQAYNISGNI